MKPLRAITRLAVSTLVALAISQPILSTHAGALRDRYSAFGNNTLGDCTYAAEANLVRWKWPNAPITTSQVVDAWQAQPGLALTYFVTTGFGGHRIAGFSEYDSVMNRPEVQAAIEGGGLIAWVETPWGFHAVAIIGATVTGPVAVTWGQVQHWTWTQWVEAFSSAYAVTWASPGTPSMVSFVMTVPGTQRLAPVPVPGGSSVTLPTFTLASSEYPYLAFCGWAPSPDSIVGVPVANGATMTVTVGAVLYGVWYPSSQGC